MKMTEIKKMKKVELVDLMVKVNGEKVALETKVREAREEYKKLLSEKLELENSVPSNNKLVVELSRVRLWNDPKVSKSGKVYNMGFVNFIVNDITVCDWMVAKYVKSEDLIVFQPTPRGDEGYKGRDGKTYYNYPVRVPNYNKVTELLAKLIKKAIDEKSDVIMYVGAKDTDK